MNLFKINQQRRIQLTFQLPQSFETVFLATVVRVRGARAFFLIVKKKVLNGELHLVDRLGQVG